jgi:hypothetical protein
MTALQRRARIRWRNITLPIVAILTIGTTAACLVLWGAR